MTRAAPDATAAVLFLPARVPSAGLGVPGSGERRQAVATGAGRDG